MRCVSAADLKLLVVLLVALLLQEQLLVLVQQVVRLGPSVLLQLVEAPLLFAQTRPQAADLLVLNAQLRLLPPKTAEG